MGDVFLRLSDLQSKKIVNIVNGSNFGNIIDIDIDNDGKIDSFLIERGKNIFSLNRDDNIRIKWNQIIKIGEDVILIKQE